MSCLIPKFIVNLCEIIGVRFIISIVFTQHLLKGLVLGWVTIPTLYLYGALGIDAGAMQRHLTVVSIPFSMKPIIGLISDRIPIFGYHKIPYMLIALISGSIASFGIALFWRYSVFLLTTLLFIIFIQVATVDILMEAKCAEKQNFYPESAVDLMTFVSRGIILFSLFSLISVYIFIMFFEAQWIYLICIPVMIATSFPIIFNYIDDIKTPIITTNISSDSSSSDLETFTIIPSRVLDFSLSTDEEEIFNAMDRITNGDGKDDGIGKKVNNSKRITKSEEEEEQQSEFYIPKNYQNISLIVMVFIIILLAIVIILITVLQISSSYVMIILFICSIVLLISFSLTTSPITFKVISFLFINGITSIPLSSAIFYFFTDNEYIYPEGPNFSPFFYILTIGICETLFSFIGITIYDKFLTSITYRNIFIISTIGVALLNVIETLVFLRWNIILGIPDYIFIIVIESLTHTINSFTSIPSIVLLSKLCPENTEATMFSLLVGAWNMSRAIGSYEGVFLMDITGLNPNGQKGDHFKFDILWILHLFVTILPLISLFLIHRLIPEGSPSIENKQHYDEHT